MTNGNDQLEPQSIQTVTVPEVGTVRMGTWTQRAGMKLAGYVGSVGAAVILVIIFRWCANTPNAPVLTPNLKPEEADQILKNYKFLCDQAAQNAVQMFETIVVKAILPLFTGILGYIFGAQSSARNDD